MPVYEYYCPECKSKFELLRPMSESSGAASCPSCSGRAWKTLSVIAPVSREAFGELAPVGGGGGCACGGDGPCMA